jgi:hypothetical protein
LVHAFLKRQKKKHGLTLTFADENRMIRDPGIINLKASGPYGPKGCIKNYK